MLDSLICVGNYERPPAEGGAEAKRLLQLEALRRSRSRPRMGRAAAVVVARKAEDPHAPRPTAAAREAADAPSLASRVSSRRLDSAALMRLGPVSRGGRLHLPCEQGGARRARSRWCRAPDLLTSHVMHSRKLAQSSRGVAGGRARTPAAASPSRPTAPPNHRSVRPTDRDGSSGAVVRPRGGGRPPGASPCLRQSDGGRRRPSRPLTVGVTARSPARSSPSKSSPRARPRSYPTAVWSRAEPLHQRGRWSPHPLP